ncbi:hypothetical protein [Methylocystis sp. S23]|jgi:hypothetical protein
MTMVQSLLRLADETAKNGAKNATFKRRAVSTAYYAVFHAIAEMCAREMLGGVRTSSYEFERVYRALEHGSLKSVFNGPPLNADMQLKQLGILIAQLQSERHRSDYLPMRNLYTAKTCAQHLASAKLAITLLEGLSREDRKALAVTLLFKNRS